MHAEEHAILLHDIRAAMVNHSGLHKEIQDSLRSLTDVLHCLVPSPDSDATALSSVQKQELESKVEELLSEDIDQCLPMLQLSSDRLSILLKTLVQQDRGRQA